MRERMVSTDFILAAMKSSYERSTRERGMDRKKVASVIGAFGGALSARMGLTQEESEEFLALTVMTLFGPEPGV